MATILLAATATPGHVNPMLAVARLLVGEGHRVLMLCGALFEKGIRQSGAEFVPFAPEVDFDYRALERHFPERASLSGTAQMALALKRFFAAPMAQHDRQLRALIAAEGVDLLLVENGFYGVLPLLQQPHGRPVPILMLGVNPVSYSSPDAIFYGPRIPPELRRSLGELPWLDEPTRQLQREVQQRFDAALAEAGAPPLTAPFTDVMVTAPDAFLQLSCAGFEYERPELEGVIRYVGPLLPPRLELTPPPWWERLDERPLVIVSQGTLANVDLGQLLLPAMQGLAGDELQLLLTTGGRDPALLGDAIPANAIVTDHVPFELALPRAAALVTNGGYGSVQSALAHGVPLVVAGTGEDKAEVATRVAWSGAGINLHSNEPTAEAVATAVRKVVSEPRYRARARLLAEEMAALDGRAAIATSVAGLLGGRP
ncbi:MULTISPECIES: nucleotide disphospho-sugar-binding domain-containing protein [Aeromonas]|uniref:nucleotide disphospho-sugar-binding domain-containing protein n=1 Tax=Aeromonas TaxID=642 RepID=UPI00111A5567|nr:nucleotide disphospho-sugar-binding domain-containing protein [Aeromonas dhakensis]TNI57381.1 N-glycosyltransferase [Aeromonas dhakensis]